MVRSEDAVIARYKHENETFELLVDPDLAMDLRSGKDVNFNDLVSIDRVFKDANRGEEKSEAIVKKVFGTDDFNKIARKIICDGEVHLTTEQKRHMLEARRKEVIALIARNAFNPQTNAPHPPQRIETAMEEAKIHVDLFKPAAEQMNDVVKEIRKLIPISMEKIKFAVRISAQYSGKGTALLHRYDVQKEEWQRDGSLVAVLELPIGVKQDMMNDLNALTHGSVDIKILDR